MLTSLANNRADTYYLLLAKVLAVVFRDEKSADIILAKLPAMMRSALSRILVDDWRGEDTRIFVEFPKTGENDHMSYWQQQQQLYLGIEEGASELKIHYHEAFAEHSKPFPSFHELENWRDVRVKDPCHADAFVRNLELWRLMADNVFQTTHLPREEIKFLSPIVKDLSNRLTLHCKGIENSMESMKQEAKRLEETVREQQASIKKLQEEMDRWKERVQSSVADLEELLARFDAKNGTETQAAITRQEAVAISFEAVEEKHEREKDTETGLELNTPLSKMRRIVDHIVTRFENYEFEIQHRQHHLRTTISSLSKKEESFRQLQLKSTNECKRIKTLEDELELRNRDFAKVTEQLLSSQIKLSDLSYGESHEDNELGSRILAKSKREIQALKDEMKIKSLLIEQLRTDLHGLEQHNKNQILEHGPIRAERDTLQSALGEVLKAVNEQIEKPIIYERDHSHLVQWIEKRARRYRDAEKDLKTLQSKHETQTKEKEVLKRIVEEKDREIKNWRKKMLDQPQESIRLASELEAATRYIQKLESQIEVSGRKTIEESQKIKMLPGNVPTNTKGAKKMPFSGPATTAPPPQACQLANYTSKSPTNYTSQSVGTQTMGAGSVRISITDEYKAKNGDNGEKPKDRTKKHLKAARKRKEEAMPPSSTRRLRSEAKIKGPRPGPIPLTATETVFRVRVAKGQPAAK
ncbi:hypothetical protein FOMG_18816 [Fusarium oxysporum f. sp. melonis 26406]|uniref:Uncharacterized protein n=1 Tax=Fusarium oxysporum f. sp. melonis 26406 TaxID=1089452 RepID=W9Z863_FUSOX|nr:hypothetical protein FOMG_18816 [Fusarium oxysporum f. sp. melonis 26406]